MRSPSSVATWMSSLAPSSSRSPVGKTGMAMLGYVLARHSWGNGYATEAAGALLRYGFAELGLQPDLGHLRS